MALAFDEFGRPFILIKVRSQQTATSLHRPPPCAARCRLHQRCALRERTRAAAALVVRRTKPALQRNRALWKLQPRLGLLTAAAGVLRLFAGTPAPAFTPGLLRLLTRPRCAAQEQAQKARVRGLEAQKQHIMAAKSVAKTLRSSLGPKGMDKMLQSGDGDVTISARPLRRAPARGSSRP